MNYWNNKKCLLIYGENNKPIFLNKGDVVPDGSITSDRVAYFAKKGKIVTDLPDEMKKEKKFKKLTKKGDK
jgi:hypothetical protein